MALSADAKDGSIDFVKLLWEGIRLDEVLSSLI